MSKEYLEVEDIDDFMKIAEKVDIILRIDPFIVINYYGTFFYIDLSRVPSEKIKKILTWLRGKLVNIRKLDAFRSLSEFYEERIQVDDER